MGLPARLPFLRLAAVETHCVYASLDGDANSDGGLSHLNEVVRACWVFFSMRHGLPDPSTLLIVYVLYATNPQGFINIDWRHKMDGILLAGPGPGNTLHFSDESKTTHNGTYASKIVFDSDFFSFLWFPPPPTLFVVFSTSGMVRNCMVIWRSRLSVYI